MPTLLQTTVILVVQYPRVRKGKKKSYHTSINMSIEAWAREVRQDRWRQDPEHQRAIDTIQSVLEGKATSSDAARIISSLYEPLIKSGTMSVPTLWGIFCDAARVLGGK